MPVPLVRREFGQPIKVNRGKAFLPNSSLSFNSLGSTAENTKIIPEILECEHGTGHRKKPEAYGKGDRRERHKKVLEVFSDFVFKSPLFERSR